MVTKRRPWPTHAKWAREDSIAWAKKIHKLGEDAKRAQDEGNHYKERIAIIEMQNLAGQISIALTEVEAPPDEEEREGEEEKPRAKLRRVQ
jgi:hypothetical protein